jgi:murein DD-endopeptidase MepM/ murein hydrolase activator NlpD
MERKRLFLLLLVGLLAWSPLLTVAQEEAAVAEEDADATQGGLKREIDQLNAQVKQKESRIKELESVIGNYKTKIAEQEAEVSSLQNQIALLANRIQEKELAIEKTKQQIEVANLEIQSLGNQIKIEQSVIARREASLAELVRKIHEADRVSTFDVFMARPSLSEFFARLDELKRVEEDLTRATRSLKDTKERLEARKKQQEEFRLALQDQKQRLIKEQIELEGDRGAKVSLVTESQNEEEEFRRILYELRQQQQEEADDVAALQDRLKEKLDSIDQALARGDILLSWPISVTRGISAHFHDPTYPFRKLFEHPGTDIPASVGTPVRAAAGGYVAWNRRGKQYGNYVMLVHPGGIATVYAHLSRFAVEPDTYVERGDVIGYSGGRPGDAGAGLSTGPHLHFEVRQNGIPVNAMQYLPSLD